jgi:hypothetical protein
MTSNKFKDDHYCAVRQICYFKEADIIKETIKLLD